MNKTKIPWADWTWNPIVGCSPASAGCANCYAAAISRRFHLPWGSAHFMPDRLDQPARVCKPGRVFVCSMADIGHETVKPGWRELVYSAMWVAPWHTYIILTKRPGEWMRNAPPGVWMGVTAENQDTANARVPILLSMAAAVRFVSVEPMLGPVVLSERAMAKGWCGCGECGTREGGFPCPTPLRGIDWVIAGPETGPKARLCEDAWIDALAIESQCFFDKRQNGKRREFPKR